MKIGNSVGQAIEVDVQEDGVGWGDYIWVHVVIELNTLIARGRKINILGDEGWVSLKYEKLLRLCFYCGCIVHLSGGRARK